MGVAGGATNGLLVDDALIADWLSEMMLAPPDADRVRILSASAGQAALAQIGEVLGAQAITARLSAWLREQPPERVAEELLVQYSRRFIAYSRRIDYLPPYAGLWSAVERRFEGAAAVRMRDILSRLDLHMAEGCCEAPDHLGIQLAALAESLRQQEKAGEQTEVVACMLQELRWTGGFIGALVDTEPDQFYGLLGQLMQQFLEQLYAKHSVISPKKQGTFIIS